MAGRRVNASITVYLSLIFVLILSLIFVSLEASRAAVMRGCARMALDAGIESVLADYYRPLFDRYKVFALDLSYGSARATLSEAEQRLQKYAELNVGDYSVKSSRISKTVPVTSEGGVYFVKQAIDAEKITLVEGVLESLAERLGLLTGKGDVSGILSKRSELEKELAELDMFTVDLMRIIDGVDIDTENILTGGGVFKIGESFVKRFLIGENDSISVGINNPSIYAGLKDKYTDPMERTADLAEQMQEYAELTKAMEEKYAEKQDLEVEIEKLKLKLPDTGEEAESGESRDTQRENERPGNKTGDEPAEIKETREKIAELNAELEIIKTEYDESKEAVSEAYDLCKTETEALNDLYSDTEKMLKEAREVTSEAEELQESLRPKVEAFENLLKNSEGIVDEDTLNLLGESLKSMKEYTGLAEGQTVTDFAALGKTVFADILLLNGNSATDYLEMPEQESEAISKRAKELATLAERMEDFSYDGMIFDYSVSEVLSEEKAAADAVSSLLLDPASDYWLELVLGSGADISDAKIKRFLLPVIEGREGAESCSIDMGENTVFSTISSILGKGFSELYDKAVFSMYLYDHFNNLLCPGNMSGTVLKYEQEYLLCGNDSDKINLAGTSAQIMMIRLIPSLLFALTDPSVSGRAGAVAQAAVGFAGLPFLVLVVKYLILTVWAAEQAVIETSAVLRGKNVPVLSNADSFCLEISELVSFGPALVEAKAGSFSEGPVSLSYGEYLLILLMTKKSETLAGRAMDMIQENLRYAYEDSFLISDCVVGFCAEAEVGSEMKYLPDFLKLPGLQTESGYSVKVSGEGAYCHTK